MNVKYKIIISALLGIVAVLALEQFTDIDLWLSDRIYNFRTHQWPIPYHLHQKLNPIFYDGAKHLVATVGTFCVLYMIYALWKPQYRCRFSAALTILLCTIIIPTSVGQLKKQSNVYCPNQLAHYEASYPYARVFEHYPADFVPRHHGRCFPAGHISGAFALMSMYMLFKTKRNQRLALTAALLLAFTNGAYQLLRGEHFISHNFISLFIAMILIVLINTVIKSLFRRLPQRYHFQ